jgi:hypothetical protein
MKFLPGVLNKEEGTLGRRAALRFTDPVQWFKEKNAGFWTAPPENLYLSIDPSEPRPDVATQENDPASM